MTLKFDTDPLTEFLKDAEPYYEKTFERHRKDIESVESGEKRDIRFNKKLGLAYVKIIENLKHSKGEKAGKLIKLEPWQKKVVMILFGWQRRKKSGKWVRRFRTAFIFLPRKNGKTDIAAAMSVSDMIIREEIGGEVAFFATKKDQAKLCYKAAKYMLENQHDLKEYTHEVYGRLEFRRSDTELYTIGRDSTTLDGLNVSVGVCDEHHAHRDDSVWDVIKSSQMARREPLMLSITTAGFNVASPAKRMYDYAKRVLDGVIEDDSFFAFIAEAPPKHDDDPEFYFREEVWRAANPNYGVSVDPEEFALAAKEARDRPDKLNNFLVKYLNVWTSASEAFIPLHKWESCKGEVQRYGEFIGGLDMSLRDDFTAFAMMWRIDGKYHVDVKFYIPEDTVADREKELQVPLVGWVNAGHITATPGNSVDDEYIINDIVQHIDDMEAFCYDPNRAKRVVRVLEDEYSYENCILIPQWPKHLNEPTSYFLKLVKDGDIVHDGNPVLTWMVSNLSVVYNTYGEMKPDKSDYNRKIDGVAAIINTLAYLIHTHEEPKKAVYEERGLRDL